MKIHLLAAEINCVGMLCVYMCAAAGGEASNLNVQMELLKIRSTNMRLEMDATMERCSGCAE